MWKGQCNYNWVYNCGARVSISWNTCWREGDEEEGAQAHINVSQVHQSCKYISLVQLGLGWRCG